MRVLIKAEWPNNGGFYERLLQKIPKGLLLVCGSWW